MRVLVHDYAGHPFQVQLSRELARRGHDVLHLHFGGFQTPKAALIKRPEDPTSFTVEPIELDRPFSKYELMRRLVQEREVGRLLAGRIERFDPDVVISANAPLDVQSAAGRAARSRDAAFVFWLQDIYSVAIDRHLRRRHPFVRPLIARRFTALERRLLRGADAVVAITDDFRPTLDRWGVDSTRVFTIHNWAPLDDIGPRAKANPWACEQRLDNRPVVLYAGTLGLKHNPSQLLEVARRLEAELPEARMVVVSEGLGAAWLRDYSDGIRSLIQLPFQPFENVADMIGAADIVVAILEPDAGAFSVPSKVLTYLAAGRPIVAAIPKENLAARLIAASGAGMVVSPRELGSLADACIDLLAREDDCVTMGRQGRAYAESAFEMGHIADQFEALLTAAAGNTTRAQPSAAGLPAGSKDSRAFVGAAETGSQTPGGPDGGH